MSKQWLLIVFDGSGNRPLMKALGLAQSKSKVGQFVGFYSIDATAILRRQIDRLKEAGLHGIAKKVDQDRPRGRAGRAAYDAERRETETDRYVKKSLHKAEAVARATQIESLKRQRNQQDEAKRRREFAKQAAQATQRDQQRHAENVLALLSNPIGSA